MIMHGEESLLPWYLLLQRDGLETLIVEKGLCVILSGGFFFGWSLGFHISHTPLVLSVYW